MEINTLGSILKYYRKKYNLRQEEVCNGICTTTVYSQIENGKKVVDSLIAETLLGRIGKTVLQFELLLNEDDYELWNLREKIKDAENNDDYIQMKSFLEEYGKKMPKKSVHKQIFLFESIKCQILWGKTNEGVGKSLYNILQITQPNWNQEKETLLSPLEIEIILLIYKFQEGKWIDIEKSLIKILMFIKEKYSECLKQDIGNKVLMYLIEYKKKEEDYICAVKYIDQAIELHSNGRSIKNIAELHFLKAQMIKKGCIEREQWIIEKRKCKMECLMAYHVFVVMGQEEDCKEVQKFCEEELEWQIIE